MPKCSSNLSTYTIFVVCSAAVCVATTLGGKWVVLTNQPQPKRGIACRVGVYGAFHVNSVEDKSQKVRK